jgi:mitochondrial cardiolipin hydrolase
MEFLKQILALIGLLSAILIPTRHSRAVEVYFTPGTACEDQIISAINGAKSEVVAAVYSINNQRIITALVAAHKRGIKIRILTDRTQAAGSSSKLVDAGVNLKIHSKHKIEHNKFVVADSKVAINGSYNWTEPATKVNSENCSVMPEANAIASYRKRFDELWKLNSQVRSIASIRKIRAKHSQ